MKVDPTYLKLDNSKRSDYVSCPRKFYWKYVRGITPSIGSTALRYGSVWHKAMEVFYNVVKEVGWVKSDPLVKAIQAAKEAWDEESREREFYDDYRTLENLMKSLLQFVAHFAGDEAMLEVLSAEKIFCIAMTHGPNDKIQFPPFYFTGKIDLKVKLNGRIWIVDHKTTGQSLSIQQTRLNRSPQFIGYYAAGKKVFEEAPEGMLVVLHHLSAYKSKKTGNYGKPKIDFARVPQIYSNADITEWRNSLCTTARHIYDSITDENWPMCFDSCYTYGRCAYTNLCEQGRELGHEVLGDSYIQDEIWDVTTGEKLEVIEW